jgi:hypothetical protein
MFPRGLNPRLRSVHLRLSSQLDKPADLTLHLRGGASLGDFSATNDLAVASARVPARRTAFVEFKFDCAVEQPYLWVWLPKAAGISWSLADSLPENCRAYGGGGARPWTVVKGQHYAMFTDPPLRFATDHRPENVIDGVSRTVGTMSHLWASDPQQPMPQWLELDFRKPVEMNAVQLTFDTNLNHRFPEGPMVAECVKDYRLSYFNGTAWIELLAVKNNFLRHRIHRFPTVTASKLRLTVEETNGDDSARVFEVRVYRELDAP